MRSALVSVRQSTPFPLQHFVFGATSASGTSIAVRRKSYVSSHTFLTPSLDTRCAHLGLSCWLSVAPVALISEPRLSFELFPHVTKDAKPEARPKPRQRGKE